MTVYVRDPAGDLVGSFFWDGSSPLPVPGDVIDLFDQRGRPTSRRVRARAMAQSAPGGELRLRMVIVEFEVGS